MNIFSAAAIVLVLVMAVTLYRVVTGPTIYDRFLAASMSGTTAAFAIGLIGFWLERPSMFSDILLAYSLLNFIAAIVAAKFLEKR